MKKEYKIGLAFVISIIIFFGIIKWFSSGGNYSAQRKTIRAFFDDIGGLGPGDPVFVYGLKKGNVESFKLLSKGVEVRMKVDTDVRIYEDGYASINMKEIMGGKKIDLFPGTNNYDKTDSVRGISGMDISQVMSKFGRVFADMSDQNLSFTIASFANLSLKLAMVIESVNPKNLRETMDGIDMIIQDINKKKVVDEITTTINNYNKVAAKINHFMEMVDSLPFDSKHTFSQMNKMFVKTETTLDLAEESLRSMKMVMDKMLDKETIAGKILADKEFSSRADTLMRKVEETLDFIRNNRMVVGVRFGGPSK